MGRRRWAGRGCEGEGVRLADPADAAVLRVLVLAAGRYWGGFLGFERCIAKRGC
jgi:hypothetical protein